MSANKRFSTVHDLATLRLHPDGSRVSLSQTNKKGRKSTYTTRDNRGNWIAHDAGGAGRVKLRRAATKSHEGEGDEDESVEENQGAGPSSPPVDKGKKRALGREEGEPKVVKDSRAKKRKLFHEDIGLHTSSPAQTGSPTLPANESTPAPLNPTCTTNPSSDLLKCIHHFASTYYSEMGQLRDSAKTFRKEKKLRRLARLERQAAEEANRLNGTNQPKEEDEIEPSSSEDESSNSETGSSTSETSETSETSQRKRGIRSARRVETLANVDMYKVFDGSALMAIGMLLQHHVDDQLAPRIPEGWEETTMEDADTNSKMAKRRDRAAKMRVEKKDDFGEQFFDEEDEGVDDRPRDGELGLELLDGDAEEDEDYTPDSD